ncbi:MAG: tetratricopeptide repeat protein [Candidatus Omnitrophota bacterium]
MLFTASCILRPVTCAVYAQEPSKEEEALFVAQKAFEDGFYEVSLGLLERFLKNYPDSKKTAEATLLMGQCYFHQNKFLDALAKFEGLLNQPSARSLQDAVLYWIAEVHFKGNNFTKAASYYKKIIDDFPKSSYAPIAYYSIGWCLFQENDFPQAWEYFKTAEERFPKESFVQDASFKIIECLYNLKDYAALKEKAKEYLKNYPKDTARVPYLYFYLGEADYYLNNFEEAIKGYSKALAGAQNEETRGLARLGLGWSYLKLKRFSLAETVLQEIKPDSLGKSGGDALLLGKAKLMLEYKRYSEAQDLYSSLLNTTGDPLVMVQAYLGKADALYNYGEYKQAIAVYNEALGKISGSAPPRDLSDELHYGLAWAYLKEGQFKEAIDEFQKIAKHSEDKILKVSALCQIGDAYQDSGDYAKAQETYDSILKNYPDSFYADYVQYQLGACLLKNSNYEGAIMAFQSMKNRFPDSKLLDDASYALGLSYFQQENYAAAEEVFKKFPEEFRESSLRPQVMYLWGTSLYNLGKFSEAIEVYKNVIRMYGDDTELAQKAEYEIADCYYQMGNEKEAMAKFKMLRSKYPASSLTPEIIWWLGEYYYRHNDLNLSRRYFLSLIKDFPRSSLIPNAYYALGSSYQEESKYEEAIANFKKVMELGRTDLAAQAAIAIADIYLKQDKIDLALKIYKETVGEYANLAGLIYPKIAEAYRSIGNFAEALDFYRKSLDIVPVREMSNIQFKIAETIEAEGKLDEAIEEYLKVTYLYAENNALAVKALLRAASIYEGREDFQEAGKIYKRIAGMDVEEAKYARERIDWIKTHVK